MNVMNKEELSLKEKREKQEGFVRWMDQPATRMMMSMIPKCENPEVLQTLLQETYNAGYSNGGGSMIGMVLDSVLKGMDKKPPAT